MKRIVAKLKGQKQEHRLLVDSESDMHAYLSANFPKATTDYDPAHPGLDSDEWFTVTLDDEQYEQMVEPFASRALAMLSEAEQTDHQQIDTVYVIDGKRIAFWRLLASQKLSEDAPAYVELGEDAAQIRQPQFSLRLPLQADAYFDGDKTIAFRNFGAAKRLFKGIEVFHNAATRPAKQAFFNHEIFSADHMNPDFVSASDAKNMQKILDEGALDLNDNVTIAKVVQYIHEYPASGASVDADGKLLVGTKEELQAAIKVLQQRYFTSAVTGEKFVASSVKKLPR